MGGGCWVGGGAGAGRWLSGAVPVAVCPPRLYTATLRGAEAHQGSAGASVSVRGVGGRVGWVGVAVVVVGGCGCGCEGGGLANLGLSGPVAGPGGSRWHAAGRPRAMTPLCRPPLRTCADSRIRPVHTRRERAAKTGAISGRPLCQCTIGLAPQARFSPCHGRRLGGHTPNVRVPHNGCAVGHGRPDVPCVPSPSTRAAPSVEATALLVSSCLGTRATPRRPPQPWHTAHAHQHHAHLRMPHRPHSPAVLTLSPPNTITHPHRTPTRHTRTRLAHKGANAAPLRGPSQGFPCGRWCADPCRDARAGILARNTTRAPARASLWGAQGAPARASL